MPCASACVQAGPVLHFLTQPSLIKAAHAHFTDGEMQAQQGKWLVKGTQRGRAPGLTPGLNGCKVRAAFFLSCPLRLELDPDLASAWRAVRGGQ